MNIKKELNLFLEKRTSQNNNDEFEKLLRKYYITKDVSDKTELESYIDDVQQIPFGNYKKIINCSSRVRKKLFLLLSQEELNDKFIGNDEIKNEILGIILSLITPEIKNQGLVLGLQGKAGSGKTELVKNNLSSITNLPVFHISLGGCQDGTYLDGFDRCYKGSSWGIIMDAIIKTKCMNPIIFFDELDKISKTERGSEIINKLIHIIDPVQNKTFVDRYFKKFDIDLSKITFIFSFNNKDNIDKILLDRIRILEISDYTIDKKLDIFKNIIIPKLNKNYNMNLLFSDECLKTLFLLDYDKNETTGIREINQILDKFYLNFNLKQVIENLESKNIIEYDFLSKIIQIKKGKKQENLMYI